MRIGSSRKAAHGTRPASGRDAKRLSRPRRALVGALIVLTLLAAAFTTLVEAGHGPAPGPESRSVPAPR